MRDFVHVGVDPYGIDYNVYLRPGESDRSMSQRVTAMHQRLGEIWDAHGPVPTDYPFARPKPLKPRLPAPPRYVRRIRPGVYRVTLPRLVVGMLEGYSEGEWDGAAWPGPETLVRCSFIQGTLTDLTVALSTSDLLVNEESSEGSLSEGYWAGMPPGLAQHAAERLLKRLKEARSILAHAVDWIEKVEGLA